MPIKDELGLKYFVLRRVSLCWWFDFSVQEKTFSYWEHERQFVWLGMHTRKHLVCSRKGINPGGGVGCPGRGDESGRAGTEGELAREAARGQGV